jgi:hypothetical protein
MSDSEVRSFSRCVNHKRLVRIMREDNLLCLRKPLFKPATTDSRHSWRVWPNLAKHLAPMAANQLWVADITYVRLDEAFVYLAVILDAFSRKVVGWAMADPCAPNWPRKRWRWRCKPARLSAAVWSITPIAGSSTPVGTTSLASKPPVSNPA